jgi:glycosyltransferase 2 family protein
LVRVAEESSQTTAPPREAGISEAEVEAEATTLLGLGRDRLSTFAGFALSALALGACVWWALQQPAPQFPTSTRSLALLLGAVAVLAFTYSLRGFRWSMILRAAGIHVDRAEPYALVVVGAMGNTVLPARGGEVIRVVLLKERSDTGWAGAIGSVIPERVLDITSLTVVLAILLAAGVIDIDGTVVLFGAIAVALIVAAALALLTIRRRGYLNNFAERVRPFLHASRMLLTPAGAALLALSGAIWAVDGTIFWLVAEAVDLNLDPAEAIGLAAVGAASSSIPAAPGFAGTYDGALLITLGAYGVVGAAAISYVLLVRFVIFVPVAAAGLVITVTRYGGITRLLARARGEARIS